MEDERILDLFFERSEQAIGELDKKYDEPETVAFVNGVLGGFVRGEKPEALGAAE